MKSQIDDAAVQQPKQAWRQQKMKQNKKKRLQLKYLIPEIFGQNQPILCLVGRYVQKTRHFQVELSTEAMCN